VPRSQKGLPQTVPPADHGTDRNERAANYTDVVCQLDTRVTEVFYVKGVPFGTPDRYVP
jgi:hypothetical protein